MPETRIVGAYEAKTTLSALLDFVEQGHDVVITKHDRPVARLVPVGRRIDRGEAFDRLRSLRGRLELGRRETAKDLISAGRRI